MAAKPTASRPRRPRATARGSSRCEEVPSRRGVAKPPVAVVSPALRRRAPPVDGVVGWTRAVSAPTPTNGWPAVGVQVNVAITVTAVPTSLMVDTIFKDFWAKNTLLVPFTGVQLVAGRRQGGHERLGLPAYDLMTAVWEMT